MKQLILVRHGDYFGNSLSGYGRNQIKLLASKLKPFINGHSVAILTSTAGRACESADILGSFFGVDYEQHEVLWSENRHRENFVEALNLVRLNKNKADTLILVTHYEYVQKFPRYFAEKEMNVHFSSRLIGKGEAWVIDCQQKKIVHVY